MVVVLSILSILLLNSFPQPAHAASNDSPIKHIIVIMQENHSFDNYFGTFPGATGLGKYIALPTSNGSNELVRPFHISGASVPRDLCHAWECEHEAYDSGKMDRFAIAAGSNLTMGYFDHHEIPYYWDYASRFVLLDNFYSSVMADSLPNHLYLMAGQSGGTIRRVLNATFDFKSIVDTLDASKVSWKYYAGGHSHLNGWNPLPAFASFKANQSRLNNLAEPVQFYLDLATNKLADVTWIMPWKGESSEHPPYDISIGQASVVSLVNAVMLSSYWNSTAIFLTWDESGGWYDHVPPPQIDAYGYGFRVPCLIISPYARQGFVDHTQGDSTSILKFIETLYSLPSLAERDATANNLLDAFDFSQAPRNPLILPGLYVPDHYPLSPRANNSGTLGTLPAPPTSSPSKILKMPNLATTFVSISPAQPKAGEDITVTFAVKNFGKADSSGFTMALYLNSTSYDYKRVDSLRVPSLKAGESETLSFSNKIRALTGTHTITVVANELHEVQESNDLNNAMTRNYLVSPAHSESYPTTSTIAFIGLVAVGTGIVAFLFGLMAKKIMRPNRGFKSRRQVGVRKILG
jgi:phospholipase C